MTVREKTRECGRLVVGSPRDCQQSQQHQHQQQVQENFARLYTALRHEELRPVCRYCGRSYSSPSNLRQHVKNVHSSWPPADTWPQCNVCGKRCKTKHYLINHQLQAHGIHQRPSTANSSSSHP